MPYQHHYTTDYIYIYIYENKYKVRYFTYIYVFNIHIITRCSILIQTTIKYKQVYSLCYILNLNEYML